MQKEYSVEYLVKNVGWVKDVSFIAECEEEIIDMVEEGLQRIWIQAYPDENSSEIVGFKTSEIEQYRISRTESKDKFFTGYENLSFLSDHNYHWQVRDYLASKLNKNEIHLILPSQKIFGKTYLARLLNQNGYKVHEVEQLNSINNLFFGYIFLDLEDVAQRINTNELWIETV